ncbi:hypothetical protein MMB75_14535 [Paenibacillus sp. P2(2022)]|nr:MULTISPECIES: hypothetical protein [Paenibacillus]MCJ1221145.1 hypothetical protein [Paenibacillus polymyxa]MDG0054895.1 hypothetical protein [Paenibacillus sp. P2(2022)]
MSYGNVLRCSTRFDASVRKKQVGHLTFFFNYVTFSTTSEIIVNRQLTLL